jgi:hypothetical protein
MKNYEYYFIQLIFRKNPDLLKKENRDLYDAMLERYKDIFLANPIEYCEIEFINKKFMKIFGI